MNCGMGSRLLRALGSRGLLGCAAAAMACLFLASGASAADVDGFTAASTPSRVKPAGSVSYTVTLTNAQTSPDRAQRARIGIPAGFIVSAASVQATTTAVGGCDASTWVADGNLIESSKIRLKAPSGNATRLCPGATLTVGFLATTPTAQGTYTWVTELLIDELTPPFTLSGAQPTVIVDGTSPQAAITEKPSNPSNVNSPPFAFTANEASTFECKLDTGAFATCSAPKSYPNLTDGPHTFTVRATDIVGNLGAPVSYGWTVDTFAPTTAITEKPSSLSNTGSPTFVFAPSEGGSTFACRLDNGSFSSCTSPKTYTNLSDGPHSFAVRATDAAGNTGPDVAYGWTIETRSPTAAMTLAPASLSNSRLATFGFSADEPATFECNLDQRGFQPCSSPALYQGLVDGLHTFAVRPKDAVGNIGLPASHSWRIDATAPETTLVSAPRSGTVTSAAFVFSANEPARFECRIDDVPFATCASPKNYTRLRRRPHRFDVRAIDTAGNIDPTPATRRWSVLTATRTLKTASSSALLSPRAGARVTAPPLLVWRRVARASYYNVQLYRGRQKLLSAWPERTRLRLRARWNYLGRQRHLSPGVYRWYVWPGYGSPAARRYGRLVGQSRFTVVPR
jgi:hypothetical protein